MPEKNAKGNPEVAFFRDIRNKSKIREVMGVDPMAENSRSDTVRMPLCCQTLVIVVYHCTLEGIR
jgi:hypothetical protein